MEDILGFLSGAGLSLGAQWLRYDQQTQDRLRNTRADVRDLRDVMIDQQSWGNAIRDRLPVVQDWIVGLALASAQNPAPSAIPAFPALPTRPNLCSGAETAIRAFQWPPRPGQYDVRQNVQGAGELSPAALAVTFEEVRAAIYGFMKCDGSTPDGRVQIYRAVNALVEVVHGLTLTKAAYSDGWTRLFSVVSPSLDPHRDPGKPPAIGNVNAGVVSVAFIASGPLNETNPQTDFAHRLRITVGGANVAADSEICVVTFGTPYRWRKSDGTIVPMVPTVQPQSNSTVRAYAVANTNGYSLRFADQLLQNLVYDVAVISEPGVPTT